MCNWTLYEDQFQFGLIHRGYAVATLVERRTQVSMTRGSNPVRSTRKKIMTFFPSQNVVLTRGWWAHKLRVYTHA